MNKLLKTVGYLAFLAFIAVSCNNDIIFEKNKKIDEGTWDYKKPVKFEVNIKDTLTLHNFYVNVRNSGEYPYINLYLFIRTILPDKRMAVDTIEFMLADEKGEWHGSGLGDIKSLQILFKENLRFLQAGKYIFVFRHGMRKKSLKGIMDIGLTIEKTE
jgi:gliding motility-associated lipoprotein GldH